MEKATNKNLIKVCKCGCELTTENAEYLGVGLGLHHWNCPECNTTLCTKIDPKDLDEEVYIG